MEARCQEAEKRAEKLESSAADASGNSNAALESATERADSEAAKVLPRWQVCECTPSR